MGRGGLGVATLRSLENPCGSGTDGLYPARSKPAKTFDFTRDSAALAPDRVVDSACQFCNSLCRLKVHLKSGRIIDVLGEGADPVQAGGLCIKASMMTDLVYSPRRLRTPLRRVGGKKGSTESAFEPCSWEEALSVIARKFLALRDAGDARAIANKTSGRLLRGTGAIVSRFFALLGSPNDTDVGPVCNDAGGDALAATFGLGNFTNGYGRDANTGRQDLGSARFLLLLGTNQAETHPVTFAHLLRERAKTGARLVVVDPRRTPTGAQADEWIAPKPHTDLALVLGMLGHVVSHRLYDRRFVRRWILGFEELVAHLEDRRYTAQWAEGVTGVPASTIRRLAVDYARTKPAAIFCNAGISHQLNAFDTYRAIACLAAVTGNIGVPGGGCNFMHNTWPGGLVLPPLVGTVPERAPALPLGPDRFAESILESKPFPLRAVVTAGNPLIACANTHRVREAFRALDFYVYTGLFMEEAASFADIILPVCSGFEMDGVYMRRDDRGIRWQTAAVDRVGESRTDIEIWLDLAAAMARLDPRHPPEYWTDNLPAAWRDYSRLWSEFVRYTPGMSGMTKSRLEARAEPLRWPCPSEDHPGTSTLYLDHPSWYEAVSALDPARRGSRFLTPSGKVEIHTPELEARLAPAGHHALPEFYTHPDVTGGHPTVTYQKEFVANPLHPTALTPVVSIGSATRLDVPREFPLMGIIGRASVVHFAGVTQWTQIGKRMNGIRLVQIHPRAAASAGIRDGDTIRVESPRGSIRATALLWEGIREDTIFVPNSFGPTQVVGDEAGAPRYEPANLLVDDRWFDNVSGQQAYKCFACRVRKA